jgi:meso-butanediol dehydrogenase/(S,S)-butanediol dehydrogenase/diacetyl reductase
MASGTRVVIVTGAGSGIGEATAKRFLQDGAQVAVCGRDVKKLKKAFEDASSDQFLALKADVSKEAQVKSFVAAVMKKFGRVDVLVNNAGIFADGKLDKARTKTWRNVMGTDLDGVFFMSRAVLPALKKTKGCIVNISSVSGLGGDSGNPIYNAAKGAVTNLTRALAIDYAKEGVRVNAVCPTFTKTDLTEEMFEDKALVREMVSRIPMGRHGNPEDIAGAVVFLASEDARFVTGVNLPVDGGVSASNGQPI